MDDQAMNDGASKNLNVCGECGEPQIFNGLFMVCDNIQCSAAAAAPNVFPVRNARTGIVTYEIER